MAELPFEHFVAAQVASWVCHPLSPLEQEVKVAWLWEEEEGGIQALGLMMLHEKNWRNFHFWHIKCFMHAVGYYNLFTNNYSNVLLFLSLSNFLLSLSSLPFTRTCRRPFLSHPNLCFSACWLSWRWLGGRGSRRWWPFLQNIHSRRLNFSI